MAKSKSEIVFEFLAENTYSYVRYMQLPREVSEGEHDNRLDEMLTHDSDVVRKAAKKRLDTLKKN